MKKILCIHQGYELYGSDRTFIQSVRALKKKWPECSLTVHLPQKGKLWDELIPYADKLITGHMSVLRKNSFSVASIKSFIANLWHNFHQIKQHDFVYINSAVVFSYIFITFFKRKNYLLHIHEIPTGFIKLYFCFISILSKANIVANSKATKDALCKSNRVHVVYNGVKDRLYTEDSPANEITNLVLIGRLNSWKGQNIAIEALSLLVRQDIHDIHLNIVGSYFGNNAHYLTALQDKVLALNLQDKVHFHHFTNDPSSYYRAADIVLVPSIKPEPFGLVAIEAMNWSKPVIAANHGGLPEIIQQDKNGFLVEPNNPESLAQAIKTYWQNPPIALRHGAQGRRDFLDHFQESHYMNNLIKLIDTHHAA